MSTISKLGTKIPSLFKIQTDTISKIKSKFPSKERIKSFLKKPWFWGLLVVVILSIYFLNPGVRKEGTIPGAKVPHVLAPTAPTEGDPTYSNFSLTNQDEVAFGSKDLKNKPYVMNLFFVDSPTGSGTPAIHMMKKLQAKYDQDKSPLKMVSITVDAINDRPIDIKRFIDQFDLNQTRWIFLTGPAGYTRKVIESYGLRFGEREKVKEGLYDIAYDNKVIIVDGTGEIRGTYPFPSNERAIDEIFEKSHRLR